MKKINKFLNQFRYFSKLTEKLYAKRKYPVDPDSSKNLPIFQYATSKSSNKRIYVWGLAETGALGLMLSKPSHPKSPITMIKTPKRQYFGEKHEITDITCGYGFSAFAVKTDDCNKIYGTGINTDSQIGLHTKQQDHELTSLIIPQPISLPLKNPTKTQVKALSAGRAHMAILTDEGIFTLGNNAYGQCGRNIIENEKYSGNGIIHNIPNIDGQDIKDIVCGQDHTIAITENGEVYSCGWGADGQTGLGHSDNVSSFNLLGGDIKREKIIKVACTVDSVLAINSNGDLFGWGNTEYSQIPLVTDKHGITTPTYLSSCKSLGKIIDIAVGGSFCMVLNLEGDVFVWGYGLLGKGPEVQHSSEPLNIPPTLFGRNEFQPDSHVVKVTAGISHLAAINNNGDLYMWGRNKYGCLGLGHTKNQYFPLKVSIGSKVEKVCCGVDHSVAFCKPFI